MVLERARPPLSLHLPNNKYLSAILLCNSSLSHSTSLGLLKHRDKHTKHKHNTSSLAPKISSTEMSEENAKTGPGGDVPEPTAKEAMFFYHILTSNKEKLDIDWHQVAAKAGYANGGTASVRFGQIKKRLGLTKDSSPATPRKSSAKKEVGSGTKTTPSKVTKKRTPKKTSKAAEAEFFGKLAEEEDEILKAKKKEQMDDDELFGVTVFDAHDDFYHVDKNEDGEAYY